MMCTCDINDKIILTQFKYKNAAYNSLKCEICGFTQTKPVEVVKDDIYETGHYKVKAYFILPFLINLLDYGYIYISILRFNFNKKKSILDFGCGKGYFLYFLKKLGYKKLFGVETSTSRAAFSKELINLEISSEIYTGGKILEKTFDFISLIHVLEHIEDPFDFLDIMLEDAVNKNGVIFIEVPNIISFASKISKKTWAHFTPHFHVNHFTPLSFINYCKKNKYEYKLVSTFSFYNSAMGMTSALFSLFGYKGSLFEDMKNKIIIVIIGFIVLLPVTVLLEILISLFSYKGSVIKFVIKK